MFDNMSTLDHYLKIAIRASLIAGEEILKIYHSDFSIGYKDDKSPLTQADLVSNEIIRNKLETTGIPIISEESKQVSYSTRKSWSQCWIVDPIDGTKEFIKKNGEFTINIALIKNGITTLGIIYVPVDKALYYTNSNKTRAYKTVIQDVNHPLEHILFQDEHSIQLSLEHHTKVRVVGSRSHMNQETLNYVESLKEKGKQVDIVSKGSSLKFCLMAEGKADIYPRFAPTMEWDTAAGQAICEAVGLKVIDQQTDKPMTYNRENLLNSYFLVSR
ncbi:3'(2'),5'-bisphosphate nucleotidase CysQ [Aestuariivivens sediminis]|uniref:3'(2'),5'-bisphosphate nucleotidase CysQ n=1 Tax=Aestuariivivens sediminis TaxID=2913557 RepID=UPI001F57D210|nr:3'(2'),5'-bisphosphate nucleotidase CysQ [Aestuariivivens sediminis]